MSQSRIVVYVDEQDEPYVRKAVQHALDAFAVPGTYNLTVEPVTEKGDGDLRDDLRTLVNRRSRENASNTPDFILAQFMHDCLNAYEMAVTRRAEWYGRMDEPGQSSASTDAPAKSA